MTDRAELPKDSLDVSVGRTRLSAQGFGVLVLIALLAVIASTLYAGLRVEWSVESLAKQLVTTQTARKGEHDRIVTDLSKTACMLALSAEERTRFRLDFRPGAWSRWCPWITEEKP